jgi:Uma2 family endonuclease
LRQEIDEYFAIGVDRVWIVEPDNRAVTVFSSSIDSRKLTQNDDVRGES